MQTQADPAAAALLLGGGALALLCCGALWTLDVPPLLRLCVRVLSLLLPLALLQCLDVSATWDADAAASQAAASPQQSNGTGAANLTGSGSGPGPARSCVNSPCACRKRPALYSPPCALEDLAAPNASLSLCVDEGTKFGSEYASHMLESPWACHFENLGEALKYPERTEKCLGVGAPRRGPTMYMLGDSKAWQMVPALLHFFEEEAVRHVIFHPDMAAGPPNLLPSLRQVLQPGDVIGLTRAACKWVKTDGCQPDCKAYTFSIGCDLASKYEGMQRFLEELLLLVAERKAGLILMPANPLLSGAGSLTFAEAKCRADACHESWAAAMNATNVTENVFFVDYWDLLCDHSSCTGMIPGTDQVLSVDVITHLSKAAVHYLAPFLCSKFESLPASLGLARLFKNTSTPWSDKIRR